MNVKVIFTAAFLGASIVVAHAQAPEHYEVVRDTITYSTHVQLDTSDPMRYVVNNPATPPKGSGGLSHIKTTTATVNSSATEEKDSVKQQPLQTTAPKFITHTVKSGETLGKIAAKYHVSVKNLVKINGLRSADRINIGQKLKISKQS